MNARILTTSSLAIVFAVVSPAADSQLLNLVMPDAVVVAGANVAQAKTSQFGQFILLQIQSSQDQGLQKLIAATGFDPTQDVSEILAASNGTANTGLVLARGSFDAARLAAAATADGHAVLEQFQGLTIIEDQNKNFGFAFPTTTVAVAGDVADVKAAIGRVSAPSSLPAALTVQIGQWSGSQDAWVISTVPLTTFQHGAPTPVSTVPGMNGQGAFKAIQAGAAGIKFGTNDVVTAQATADNAQDAQSMADALKLLVSLAQLQAQKDPAAAALAQSLQVSASGTTLNVSLSVPETTLEQIVGSHHGTAAHRSSHRM
jgi:hypothetical protein